MIRVNLLGTQNIRRHGETWWQLSLTLFALLVLAAVGTRLHGMQDRHLTTQRDEQRRVEAELKTLQPLLKQAARLQVKKAELAQGVGDRRPAERSTTTGTAAFSNQPKPPGTDMAGHRPRH